MEPKRLGIKEPVPKRSPIPKRIADEVEEFLKEVDLDNLPFKSHERKMSETELAAADYEQNVIGALMGVDYLNETAESENEEYDLVNPNLSPSDLHHNSYGFHYRGNFEAKRINDPEAETELFFIEMKKSRGDEDWVVRRCCSLGPARLYETSATEMFCPVGTRPCCDF